MSFYCYKLQFNEFDLFPLRITKGIECPKENTKKKKRKENTNGKN